MKDGVFRAILHGGEAVVALEEIRVHAQERVELGLTPRVEGSFSRLRLAIAVAVGGEASGKATPIRGHLPQHPADGFFDPGGEYRRASLRPEPRQ